MLKRFGSRATAGILSAILSLTGFAACKQDDSTIEDIYKDRVLTREKEQASRWLAKKNEPHK